MNFVMFDTDIVMNCLFFGNPLYIGITLEYTLLKIYLLEANVFDFEKFTGKGFCLFKFV